MTTKTDRQQLLELKHDKPIRELVEEALEKHRGSRFYQTLAALELEVTLATLRNWASRMEIDLNGYGPGNDGTLQERVPAGAGKP